METLYARRPRVVVLDYLLGDHWTGLDVLEHLQQLPVSERPDVFFLTDEPSVQVAVEALQHGAKDYIEIEQGNALARSIDIIEKSLVSQITGQLDIAIDLVRFEDLIADSALASKLHSSLIQRTVRAPPIIALCGATGSGLSSLAQAFHLVRPSHGLFSVCDLRTLFQSFEKCPEYISLSSGGARSTGAHTIVLDHCEEDDGSILRCVSENRARWWSANGRNPESSMTLVVLTNDKTTAQAWVKATSAELFNVPKLTERTSDLIPMAQRFAHEARSALGSLARGKQVAVDRETLTILGNYSWPRNIRELKSLITNCVTEHCIQDKALNKSLAEAIGSARDLASETDMSSEISPISAAYMLAECGGSHRLAAVRLGVTLVKFRTLIGSSIAGVPNAK